MYECCGAASGTGSYPDPDLQHVQWPSCRTSLGQDDALKRVLGSDRITTIGKFLWRFGNDQQDKQRHGLAESGHDGGLMRSRCCPETLWTLVDP